MDYEYSEREDDSSNKRRRVEPRDFLGVDSVALALSGSDSNTSRPVESNCSYHPVADAVAIQSCDHDWQRTKLPIVWEASTGTQLLENIPLQAHAGGFECPSYLDRHRSVTPTSTIGAHSVYPDLSGCSTTSESNSSLLTDNASQYYIPPGQNLKEISPSSVVFVRSDASSRSNTVANLNSKADTVIGYSENRSKTNSEYEICFGMIRSEATKLNACVLRTNETNARVKVFLKPFRDMVIIRDRKSDSYLGHLDTLTAKALASLSSNFIVHLDASIQLGERVGHTNSGNRIAELVNVYVIIYGDRQTSDDVGKSLMEHGIFLQHPQGQDETVPYDNPHYLKRPGSQIDVSFINGKREHEGHQSLTAGTIANIFISSQGPPTWREVNGSMRLNTELKAHQKKALAMMVERERGIIECYNDFPTLWTVVSGLDNKYRYKNIVSGLTQEARPSLCLGGLLADEMGLGKTLTVLALIAGSLDDYKREAQIRQSMKRASYGQGKCNSTLIITPKSTLQSWDEQIRKHVRSNSLSVHVYHGKRKISEASKLTEFDIVITTYTTLLADYSYTAKGSSKRINILHSCHWHRVVLDEAHVVRDSLAKQSQAAHSLTALHRWCLTGTPIQNRIEDLGALLLFLRVEPFDTLSTFKYYIADPINANKERSLERLQLLVGAVALRRTKESIKTELLLPPRVSSIEEVELTASEKKLYVICRSRTLEEVDHVYSKNGKITRLCGILQSILRLRQICNYGNSVSLCFGNGGEQHDTPGGTLSSRLALCEMCGKGIETSGTGSEPALTSCMHVLCTVCASSGQESIPANAQVCPLCVGTASSEDLNEIHDSEDGIVEDSYSPSSKTLALLRNLRSYQWASAERPIKSVVFSCWIKMLNFLEETLNRESISFARIDGKKTDAQRREAIERFRADPSCTVLLASIGSAGIGLDLTAASRVHLMEPQWNPMAEEQALGRVHRMGQDQEVHAIRYIVKDSIEEASTDVRFNLTGKN
ncbi:hypothetical protein MMC27_000461 [Xylographa pallens]|nr:hypothetical protein [Xylographa pallens]